MKTLGKKVEVRKHSWRPDFRDTNSLPEAPWFFGTRDSYLLGMLVRFWFGMFEALSVRL